jgi:hypothetical protein
VRGRHAGGSWAAQESGEASVGIIRRKQSSTRSQTIRPVQGARLISHNFQLTSHRLAPIVLPCLSFPICRDLSLISFVVDAQLAPRESSSLACPLLS